MKVVPLLKIVTVSSVMRLIKNTSPKSGCIHLLVQVFFGFIIVTSFIMILLMTLKGVHNNQEVVSPCSITKCRILCVDVNFYKEEEIHVTLAASISAQPRVMQILCPFPHHPVDHQKLTQRMKRDIIANSARREQEVSQCRSNLAKDTDTDCIGVSLAMIRPIFKNGILPENWLGSLRANVRELSILEGNLKDISPRSFMDPVSDNIRTLILDKIQLTTWREDTFLGLSNLRRLYINECTFETIDENALQAVDDTLKLLDIKAVHFWNPVNVTGSSNLSKLEKVNLSYNTFYNVLSNSTFQSLQACKVLYLNSCKITFIGVGTFDHFNNLEVLYLNDNSLVTIPSGLFDNLLTSEIIRIALHQNLWLCSCAQNDLRTLHVKDVIMIEPICSYPDGLSGLTFSELEEYCDTNKSTRKPPNKIRPHKSSSCKVMSINTITQNSAECFRDNLSFNDVNKIAGPVPHTCLSNRIKFNVFNQMYNKQVFTNNRKSDMYGRWLRPLYSSRYMRTSMIEFNVTGEIGKGILWFENKNKYEVYCLNIIPNILQVFYSEPDEHYTFCLFDFMSGDVYNDNCLSYQFLEFEEESYRVSGFANFLIYVCIALGCIICGATCVFVIINRNPTLLRRNKRILLVKHKTIDALVLPPEIPIRKDVLDEIGRIEVTNEKEEKIFVLPHNDLLVQNYERSTSIRSSESNDVSYISALSPTEEQLQEWRSNAIVNDRTPTSDDDVSPFSSLYESLPYYSLREKVYETIK